VASTTILFGILLILLGVVPYLMTRQRTALIAAGFGLVLLVCGIVARNDRLRKHAMHAAVVFGLLGFLAAVGRLGMVLARGGRPTPLSGTSLGLMAVLTGIFVVLCVRSFIAARRARNAQGGFPVS
jgi:uncharacterized membrane protein